MNPNLPKLEAKNGKWYDWSPVAAKKPEAIQAYARLFREKYPDAARKADGRIEQAIKIASTPGACRPSDLTWVIEVKSQSNPRGFYTVDLNSRTCSCPDARQNPDVICKHRLAVGFHIFGPDWMYEDLSNRMQKVCKARRAAEKAWEIANDLATQYENMNPAEEGSPKSEELKAKMLKATEIAHELQDLFNSL